MSLAGSVIKGITLMPGYQAIVLDFQVFLVRDSHGIQMVDLTSCQSSQLFLSSLPNKSNENFDARNFLHISYNKNQMEYTILT